MTFTKSIENVFKNYANAKGRASRSEYWWFFLFLIIMSISIGFIAGFIAGVCVGSGIGDETTITIIAQVIAWTFALLTLCPHICVSIRRYHDSGHSGWWYFVPIMNTILLFYRSEEGENKYGLPEEDNTK